MNSSLNILKGVKVLYRIRIKYPDKPTETRERLVSGHELPKLVAQIINEGFFASGFEMLEISSTSEKEN